MQRLDKANLEEQKMLSYALRVLHEEAQKRDESSDPSEDHGQTDRDSENQRVSRSRGKGKQKKKTSKSKDYDLADMIYHWTRG